MVTLTFSSIRTNAARCARCHRPLTDPESIRRGTGPECASFSPRAEDGLCKRSEFSDQFDDSILFEQALAMKRILDRPADGLEKGIVITNVPHLVVHHSPDGYEFGYNGSGPADLALNCCQLYLNMTGYQGITVKCYDGKCWRLAYRLRHDFKDAFISSAPREGRVVPFAQIDDWFRQHITLEMIEACKVLDEN